MNAILEFDGTYQGITFDERLALRHLFCTEDDARDTNDLLPGGPMPGGDLQ